MAQPLNFTCDATTLTKIEQLAEDGLTYQAISTICKISCSRFYEVRKQYPAVEEALKRGRAQRLSILTKELYRRATDIKDNGSALFFALKTQHGFSERDGVRVNFPTLDENDTPEEILKKLIKAFDDPDIKIGTDGAGKIGQLIRNLYDIKDVKTLQDDHKELHEAFKQLLEEVKKKDDKKR